jgi:hypothetical protein
MRKERIGSWHPLDFNLSVAIVPDFDEHDSANRRL